jgi:glycine hydroxymethyltransferase
MHLLNHYFQTVAKEDWNSSAIAFLASIDEIARENPEMAKAILHELQDQRSYLKMIASENYSSRAVQVAMGNFLTDKYSEGVPFHRFYAGCENVDTIEANAVEGAKKLFGADHAYVQPHSGADANMVAFWSILVQKVQNREVEKLGQKSIDTLTPAEYERIRQLMVSQKVMGMSLNSGGHLTHGYRHNISAKMMQAVSYEVDFKTGLLDYNAIAEQAKREKPLILLAGYSAYPGKVNFAKMREIAESVGAVLMVDMAHFAGLVAGKVFTGEFDPVSYAHIVTSTTHKTLRGPRGGLVLCKEEFKETIDKGCPLVLGGPLPHVMAAKAIAFREASKEGFRTYSEQIVKNAKALAEELKRGGARVLTGTTENHMVLVDVGAYGLTGRQAETLLREKGRITCNRNAIPNDPNGAWYTSGIRLGTPALTTLGMREKEMGLIAEGIIDLLKCAKPSIVEKTGQPSKAKAECDEMTSEKVIRHVRSILTKFPLYPEIPHLDLVDTKQLASL